MKIRLPRLLLVALLASALTLHAAPYTPRSDSEVIEQLPTSPLDSTARELKALRSALAADPQNLDLAVRTARRYIQESRSRGDPRYLGYAQAALSPWWSQPRPPEPVLVLRATIRQSQHDFSAALADLSLVLKMNPENAQAWLTRATVLQVRGEYAEAERSCQALASLAPAYISRTCVAGVMAVTGKAQSAYSALRESLQRGTSTPPAERLWIETVLAEIAARLGRSAAAEEHFKSALALDPGDPYLKAAYADFLLDAGRPREVLALLAGDVRLDGLLLRLALAEHALGAPKLAEHVATLDARFTAARARGDRIHGREEARFRLELTKEHKAALDLAQANWTVQKEPADARVLLEAAWAAKSPVAAQPVLDWIAKNQVEDAKLSPLAQRLREAR